MCGICGVFHRSEEPIEPDLLARMTGVLRHRGPDGEGSFRDREVGMGHRRLSIIDVAGGGQPIANEDGAIQVVFNGEIYNFLELRNELSAAGHTFKTSSDTEVIVHGYEEWGRQCVGRFNGIFAFAVWDSHRREVFLARDHLGVKPLYFVELGERILFASEIKALLEDRNCPREIDFEALSELFTFRFVPSPKTLFAGIRKLPPGHWMTISRVGIDMGRYWDWIPREPSRYTVEQAAEQYRNLLEDSVRLQLRSDVPLGLFLSSGIDSAALLAIMSKSLSEPVQAFTIGFEGGERTNEVDDARGIARMFGAEHIFEVISPGSYMEYYRRFARDIEEPLGNETAAAFYFVSRLASDKVKVALTGQGADEPWAGYDRYYGAKLASALGGVPQSIAIPLARLVSAVPGRFERLKRGMISIGEPDDLTRFAKIYSFFSADMKKKLFRGPLEEYARGEEYRSRNALRRLYQDVEKLDPVAQLLYIDTRASLPDDLLLAADKTSMATSLEVRVPFLDYRLVEFIESLPLEFKLNGRTGKYLHKKALEQWLPSEIVYRKKKGFANPIEHWLRSSLRGEVEDFLLSSDSTIAQYCDQQYIREMLVRDRRGTEQLRRHIHLLFVLELWGREFLAR